jgi:hypothetical protein
MPDLVFFMTTNTDPKLTEIAGKLEARNSAAYSEVKTDSNPKPLNLDLLVKGPQLLKIIFEEESRPSMQWLRAQVKARSIPYLKRGRLLFFRPRTVLDFLAQKEVKPTSMRPV